MKQWRLSASVLLLAPPVLGLGRPHPLLQPRVARCCSAAPRPVAMVSLPGFGGGKAAGPPPEEMQACYRLLGVGEEADYDEVEAAFDMLYNIKYKGQTKLQIKLKVAKDKIYEERLRQRMAGTLKPVRESSPFDREVKKEFRLPGFLEGVAELPTREYFLKNAATFGAIGLVPLIGASFAGNCITIALFVACYKLYNRGAPESSDMGAEMRPPKVKPLLLTFGICFLAAALGAVVAPIVGKVLFFLPPVVLVTLCTCMSLSVASSMGKVHDGY